MKKIRGKKAWLRIVEAFIAVLLIAAFLLTLYSTKAKKTDEEIGKLQDAILNGVVQNNQLRIDILINKDTGVASFVKERLPSGLDFQVKICDVGDICSLDEYIPEVYAKERIISSTLHDYKPRKLKLFVWKK